MPCCVILWHGHTQTTLSHCETWYFTWVIVRRGKCQEVSVSGRSGRESHNVQHLRKRWRCIIPFLLIRFIKYLSIKALTVDGIILKYTSYCIAANSCHMDGCFIAQWLLYMYKYPYTIHNNQALTSNKSCQIIVVIHTKSHSQFLFFCCKTASWRVSQPAKRLVHIRTSSPVGIS